MPANRSRTSGWRRCLHQILDRNGAIEIALACQYHDDLCGNHLIWRVRLLKVSERELLVEQPVALGQEVPVAPEVELVAIIAIGQNRWMFQSKNLGTEQYKNQQGKMVTAIRLQLPDEVQRCQRRNFYRAETVGLHLPEVELWPLLDPKSVVLAERANELEYQASIETAENAETPSALELDDEDVMPEVGPQFTATMLNIGGGGVGVRIKPADTATVTRHKLFWVRIKLPPELTVPVCTSTKLVHTHLDSTQHVYAGLAFDFTFNPAHERFVGNQICRFIALQQRAMLDQAQKAPPDQRRIA